MTHLLLVKKQNCHRQELEHIQIMNKQQFVSIQNENSVVENSASAAGHLRHHRHDFYQLSLSSFFVILFVQTAPISYNSFFMVFLFN